jgi:hypothetical protein
VFFWINKLSDSKVLCCKVNKQNKLRY